MEFSEFETQHQRLTILQVLEKDSDYSHNEHVLQQALAMVGHKVSTDKLRTMLTWLSEQGLVKLDTVGSVMVSRLTTRGLDVAQGTTTTPGIARPRPVV